MDYLYKFNGCIYEPKGSYFYPLDLYKFLMRFSIDNYE